MGINLLKAWSLLVFGLFLTGCAHRHNQFKKFHKKVNCYILTIEGVECALCAKKAILVLESLPNVQYVEFVCNDENYQDCFAKMYLKNQTPIDENQIKNKLLEVGFDLNHIKKGLAS